MKKLFWYFLAFWVVLSFFLVQAEAATLSWDECTGADGYIIYFSDQSGNDYNYNNGTQLNCDTDTLNLEPGVQYDFYIRSYSAAGQSGLSNTVSFTQPSFNPPADSLPSGSYLIPDPPVLTIN